MLLENTAILCTHIGRQQDDNLEKSLSEKKIKDKHLPRGRFLMGQIDQVEKEETEHRIK